jgi:hypothetical protein
MRRLAVWLLWPVGLVGLGTAIDTRGLLEDARFSVSRRHDLMPSTRVVPTEHLVSGQPLLSVVTSDDDLHDPERGLLVHPMGRGRDWERFAYVSYFEDARLKFATGAGLRVHGGRSRVGSVHKSFGLFFRRRYGDAPDATIFFPAPSGTLQRVVVHNDIRHDRTGRPWHFVNPLAYDLAGRIGALVPRTRPMRFLLNGELHGAYVLTEHIGPQFFEARFGHSEFGIEDDANYARALQWARSLENATRNTVSEVVDLDNLTRWALSILFCGTTDIWQGALARDQQRADGRWFWINWDMDHSFMDLYQHARKPWEIDTFRRLLGVNEPRSVILTRLMKEDPGYRQWFAAQLVAMLNHRLTPAYLQGRLDHYRLAAARLGIRERESFDIVEDFFRERPAVLLAHSQKYLRVGEPQTIVVHARNDVELAVDGHVTTLPYRGVYFPETPIELELPVDRRDRFAGWLVNGEPAGRDWRLTVDAKRETRIEARFRD